MEWELQRWNDGSLAVIATVDTAANVWVAVYQLGKGLRPEQFTVPTSGGVAIGSTSRTLSQPRPLEKRPLRSDGNFIQLSQLALRNFC